MMGQDIERIVSNLDNLINVVEKSIIEFSSDIVLSIKSIGELGITNAGAEYSSTEVQQSSMNPMTSISSSLSSISSDIGRMSSLKDSLYVDSNNFNNSIGSPWNELRRLQNNVNIGVNYSNINSDFLFMGAKVGMISILNMILSSAIDCKWAIITYHDYIQRGFDNNYNNKTPSIKFKTGIDKVTNSNIRQEYDDNVNIRPPSIDPF